MVASVLLRGRPALGQRAACWDVRPLVSARVKRARLAWYRRMGHRGVAAYVEAAPATPITRPRISFGQGWRRAGPTRARRPAGARISASISAILARVEAKVDEYDQQARPGSCTSRPRSASRAGLKCMRGSLWADGSQLVAVGITVFAGEARHPRGSPGMPLR